MTKELEDTLGQFSKLHNDGYITKPRVYNNGVEIALTEAGREKIRRIEGRISFVSPNQNMNCPVCGYPAKVIQTSMARDWAELHCDNCQTYAIKADALEEASDLYLFSGYVRHHQPHMMTVHCHDKESVAQITSTSILSSKQMCFLLSFYYQKMTRFGQFIPFDLYPAIAYAKDEEDLMRLVEEGVSCGYLVFDNNMISVTEAGKAFMDVQTNHNLKQPTRPSVFISYNWGSDEIANELEECLKPYADVKRDKSSVKPWGDLVTFMNSIRYQDFAVLILSEAYLKSAACMYEVMQLMKDEHWDERVMYIVTPDAKVYNPQNQIAYIQYWQKESDELSEDLKGNDSAATANLAEELRKYRLIHLGIGSFMTKVKNANNPSADDAINKVIERVRGSAPNSPETVKLMNI
ncbi:MAG: TIR domain-containing protein [Lachnospiraceae bacterium]|nr:TIR domain-containing protein [Lachnospiraceae bacterium]